MYKLYHNKKESILRIEPMGNLIEDKSRVTVMPKPFNDFYIVCNNRKALKEKAAEIKQQWVREAEEELERLKTIEVKVKY